jgi:hypothetical protein
MLLLPPPPLCLRPPRAEGAMGGCWKRHIDPNAQYVPPLSSHLWQGLLDTPARALCTEPGIIPPPPPCACPAAHAPLPP